MSNPFSFIRDLYILLYEEKGVNYMILFIILTLIMLLLIVFTVLVASIGGAIGIILCSDIIVCIVIILFIHINIIFSI